MILSGRTGRGPLDGPHRRQGSRQSTPPVTPGDATIAAMTDPTPANLPAGAHDAGLDPVVLVAGATGLVGMAAAEHFAARLRAEPDQAPSRRLRRLRGHRGLAAPLDRPHTGRALPAALRAGAEARLDGLVRAAAAAPDERSRPARRRAALNSAARCGIPDPGAGIRTPFHDRPRPATASVGRGRGARPQRAGETPHVRRTP